MRQVGTNAAVVTDSHPRTSRLDPRTLLSESIRSPLLHPAFGLGTSRGQLDILERFRSRYFDEKSRAASAAEDRSHNATKRARTPWNKRTITQITIRNQGKLLSHPLVLRNRSRPARDHVADDTAVTTFVMTQPTTGSAKTSATIPPTTNPSRLTEASRISNTTGSSSSNC